MHRSAIEDHNRAVQLDPRSASAFNNRALAKSELGMHVAGSDKSLGRWHHDVRTSRLGDSTITLVQLLQHDIGCFKRHVGPLDEFTT